MKKKLLALIPVALLTAVVFISSCTKEEEKTYAKVLVTHSSPNAPGVDLLVDGSKQNSAALNFPNNTGYLQVESVPRPEIG